MTVSKKVKLTATAILGAVAAILIRRRRTQW